jgi:hypothetical protein
MGINSEMVYVLAAMEAAGELLGKKRIIELGAQDISAHPESILGAERRIFGYDRGTSPSSAAAFYRRYGLTEYACLDAGGSDTPGRFIVDLNEPIPEQIPAWGKFDIVTNLGTSEHCFNQRTVFANINDLCATNGLMIHVLCAQGLVNHGYYNYHPRMVYLIDYTLDNFRLYDSRDVMIYVVMQKTCEMPFQQPFDSMFQEQIRIDTYKDNLQQRSEQFQSYIKTDWSNATAPDAYLRHASEPCKE